MTVGDEVVYVHDPLLYGLMVIEAVRRNGRLDVTLDDGSTEVFDAHDLAPAEGLK